MFCPKCGAKIDDANANYCPKCGARLKEGPSVGVFDATTSGESSARTHGAQSVNRANDLGRLYVIGGLLNILFPGLGRLYLGDIGIGVAELLLAFIGIGYIWSLVDGVILLISNVD